MTDGIVRERDERGGYIVPYSPLDAVAKQIALTTHLTIDQAKHGLVQLMACGATTDQAEQIVRLGMAGPAAELLRRMKDDMNHEQTEAPTCRRLADKVMTTEDWLAKHRTHGDLETEPHNHPSGTWRWLVCECGAKHLTC